MPKKFHAKQASGIGHKHMIFNTFLGSFDALFVAFFFEYFDNSFPIFLITNYYHHIPQFIIYISLKVQKD